MRRAAARDRVFQGCGANHIPRRAPRRTPITSIGADLPLARRPRLGVAGASHPARPTVRNASRRTIRRISHDGEVSTLAGISGAAGILLGAAPRCLRPSSLAIVGDSLVIADINAILVLRHTVH
jgi:hypothetical protein